ncbi:MAG: aspartate aminotransferase family protein [Pseudomonadota bacterium]
MNIQNRDLGAYWMPFTANRQFKASPKMLSGASGMHYTTEDGRRIIDGTAGLWCCNAGHGHQEVADAVYRQLSEMDYAPSFNISHNPAFDFASRLKALAPDGFDHVFYTGSGSESVDTALKIALAYHRARGEASRTRLIGRERGYHGVGFGGISVGGIVNNRRHFGGMLTGVDHLRHTHLPENAFSKGQPEHGADLADDLERMVALHGAETIAACIVEPVAGSTGVLIPPKGYLERLREICTKHGILLIFDEVITGFGRLGTPFASQFFGVTPDLFTTAKGLTNGVVPMGAVFAQKHVHDAFMQGPENMIELFHGYTYSGHPVACAAGMAVLDIYEKGQLLTRAAKLNEKWQEAVHSLKGEPNVIDIRNLGLIGGIELASREGTPGARAYEVFTECFEQGALIRVTGDIIALSPPLIISEDQIEELIGIVREAIRKIS